MGLQFEEGARDTPALKWKESSHVRGIQQLVVETARCRIRARAEREAENAAKKEGTPVTPTEPAPPETCVEQRESVPA